MTHLDIVSGTPPCLQILATSDSVRGTYRLVKSIHINHCDATLFCLDRSGVENKILNKMAISVGQAGFPGQALFKMYYFPRFFDNLRRIPEIPETFLHDLSWALNF